MIDEDGISWAKLGGAIKESREFGSKCGYAMRTYEGFGALFEKDSEKVLINFDSEQGSILSLKAFSGYRILGVGPGDIVDDDLLSAWGQRVCKNYESEEEVVEIASGRIDVVYQVELIHPNGFPNAGVYLSENQECTGKIRKKTRVGSVGIAVKSD